MRALVPASLLLLLLACQNGGQPDYDVLIVGGLIVDGTGSGAREGSVAIRDGVIVAVGPDVQGSARNTIDADGRVISPGFIDMMGTTSLPLVLDPVSAESKLRQGITTIMVGEGGSLAPQNDETFPDVEVPKRWKTYGEYFPILEEHGIALNVIHNVGAAQVRRVVLGDEDVAPTESQLEEMKALVAQAMDDGAVGLSSSLIYPPGHYATTEELTELAKPAAERGGVYFTHMRNESGQLLEAIDEALAVGRGAGIPVHIYHLKAAGEENWPLMQEAIDKIQAAIDDGMEVTADVYPYIRNGIGLGSFLHPRHYAHGAEEFLQTLGDADVRTELRREVEETRDWENWYHHVGDDWNNVLITEVGDDSDKDLVGLSIQEAGDERGVDPWDAFFDLVQKDGASVAPKSMNEEQKHLAMQAPFMTFDNDAPPTNPASVASSHPRAFGAFPRVFAKYVREEYVIPLEDAIHKLTALPAKILRLENRGRLEVGKAADIIVFDQERIQDKATFTEPLQYSEGVDVVIVNGAVVIDEGTNTGATPGEVVRHGEEG